MILKVRNPIWRWQQQEIVKEKIAVFSFIDFFFDEKNEFEVMYTQI
jgi:hypothetical protein